MINLVLKKRIKLNTLAIVSTQFQLFNAIEVSRNFFKDKKLNVIVLVQNKVHFQQINNLAKNHDLKVIFSVKFRSIIQYIDLIIKLFRFNKKHEINNLILGHTRNNMMLYSLKKLRYKKLNFVDDGEILEVKDYRPAINKNLFPVNYYSIFNLESNSFYKFIKNEYKFFKIQSKKKFSDKILFLGSPYVEHEIISSNLFSSLLKKIILKEGSIDYFMHPRENEEKFKNLENINFFNSFLGIENYILNIDLLPKKIISFYSTALTSLSSVMELYKGRIYFIDLRKFLKHKYIRDVEYDYLKNNNKEYLIE
tara:strand:- start:2842 stop:3768 length:927 start_codon:yes stop_codon:yes gene_type:complete